jgi:3-deoxy-D-manno-octulosonic-acid transferase
MIYNVLFFFGYLLMMPRFVYRMWRRGGYRKDFLQRLGVYRPDVLQRMRERRRIWIHAVSVGEVSVAFRFMEEIRKARAEASFVLTTTTSTGHRLAEERMAATDLLLYFPSDFPVVVARVLNRLNPLALILTEGELWPNLIRLTHARGIPVALINGRVSKRSFAGYGRVRAFVQPMLEMIDLFLVQGEGDRDRLQALGAPGERLKVMGSAKYDVARPDASHTERARQALAGVGMTPDRTILVGGSTWAGEEDVLCGIFQRLRVKQPNLRLVLVPRHAERRAEVERDIRQHGLTWKRRSELNAGAAAEAMDVLLVDTTGELMGFYACASVIFVGKSLCQHGGQNVIEPAMLGQPIVVGPSMENFEPVMADFLAGKALIQVRDAEGLEREISRLVTDAAVRIELGRRAAEVVKSRHGCVKQSVELLLQVVR